jgi:hypothetical protein
VSTTVWFAFVSVFIHAGIAFSTAEGGVGSAQTKAPLALLADDPNLKSLDTKVAPTQESTAHGDKSVQNENENTEETELLSVDRSEGESGGTQNDNGEVEHPIAGSPKDSGTVHAPGFAPEESMARACQLGQPLESWKSGYEGLRDDEEYAQAETFILRTVEHGNLIPEDYVYLQAERAYMLSLLNDMERAKNIYRHILLLDADFSLKDDMPTPAREAFDAASAENQSVEEELRFFWAMENHDEIDKSPLLTITMRPLSADLIHHVSVHIGHSKRTVVSSFDAEHPLSVLLPSQAEGAIQFCFMDQHGNGLVEEKLERAELERITQRDVRYLSLVGGGLLGMGLVAGGAAGLGIVSGARVDQFSEEQTLGLYGAFFLSGAMMVAGSALAAVDHIFFSADEPSETSASRSLFQMASE